MKNQTEDKKELIKQLVLDMLNDSHEAMKKNIDKVLKSSSLDIDNWSMDNTPMVIPKCIVTAILQNESMQYEGKGTIHEQYVKKEVKNIRYFL